MARLRRPTKHKIIRAAGMYQPPEQPSKAALAARLAAEDGDESGLRRFLGPSNDGLQARLDSIEPPDTISFENPNDDQNKLEE
jgi:hypothetical protein